MATKAYADGSTVIGVQLDITGLGANAGNNYAPVGVLLENYSLQADTIQQVHNHQEVETHQVHSTIQVLPLEHKALLLE